MRVSGPQVVSVPDSLAKGKKPKIIDFTDIDMYPSRYKIENGKAVVRSLIIEDIVRQQEILRKKQTVILLDDILKVDFKFGHYDNEEWVDYYVRGLFKVKRIAELKATNEILMLVSEYNAY